MSPCDELVCVSSTLHGCSCCPLVEHCIFVTSLLHLLKHCKLLYFDNRHIMQFLVIFLLVCIAASHAFAPARASYMGKSGLQMMEKTYIMVKPDGVQRGVVGLYKWFHSLRWNFFLHMWLHAHFFLFHPGNIISRFESKGYKLSALKLTTPPKSLLEEHYKDLASKPFFPKLMGYMTSGNHSTSSFL